MVYIFTMRKDPKDAKSEIIYLHQGDSVFQEKSQIEIARVKGRVMEDLRMQSFQKRQGKQPVPDYSPFWTTWPVKKNAQFDRLEADMIEDCMKKYMEVRELTKDDPSNFQRQLRAKHSIELITEQKELEEWWKWGMTGLGLQDLH